MRTAITVKRPRDEVERRWRDAGDTLQSCDVTFRDAPGDRGTEIHVEIAKPAGNGAGRALQKLTKSKKKAKSADQLRHFKQLLETGTIVRSEHAPEGESAARKIKKRPAQPLSEKELDKVGVA
jgi:hypothetical protein